MERQELTITNSNRRFQKHKSWEVAEFNSFSQPFAEDSDCTGRT